MDSQERFDQTSLPDEKTAYSNLNIKNITDVDYRHAKRVFKEFNIKNLGGYRDLYVESDTLLLADVSQNFRSKRIEIYELDPAHFLSASGLTWQACLKLTKIKLELLTDNDMLLMVEKGIRGGVYHAIHRYSKANNKYMKNYCKNIESSYPMYLDAKNLYELAMSQKLPVDGFKWVKDLSQFNEDFIKNYDENSNKGYLLEVDVEYLKKLFNLRKDLSFLPKKEKINKYQKLVSNIKKTKRNMLFI